MTSGQEMHNLIARLYPLCRSLTGPGLRESLQVIKAKIPVELHEVPTGTKVYDWIIPREWSIRDAWIKNADGVRLVDFQKLNLHVMGYSVPVRRRMSFAELKEHLFTVPGRPDAVPYRTSYYKSNWGFCLSSAQLVQFNDGEEYDVCIDSSLKDGSLTYGELYLRGEEAKEVLISCHVCHPSLANDNLSGIAVAVALARWVMEQPRRYSYRFLFVPATVGAIAWLARNEERTGRISHGLVLTCVGDPSPITYKRSRQGRAEIDRAVSHVLKESGEPYSVIDFSPTGYDERQYCSPGIDLPVGCFMRGRHGEFPEYHTSDDNLSFVQPSALEDSLARVKAAIELLEENRIYKNLISKGEPHLSEYDFHRASDQDSNAKLRDLALRWVLNLSDGEHSLLDITEKSQLPTVLVKDAIATLVSAGLLVRV